MYQPSENVHWKENDTKWCTDSVHVTQSLKVPGEHTERNMGTPLPHQTTRSKAIQFYEFPDKLPLKKNPMTQKVLNFLARSLVLAIGLGNMSVTSEKEVIQQPTGLLHKERAPESHRADEEGLKSLTQWEQIFLACKYQSTILPSWLQCPPSERTVSFLHEVLLWATMPPKSPALFSIFW